LLPLFPAMDAAAAWFSGLFGHCTKEPATGADFVFDAESKKKEKKEKKVKKGKTAKTNTEDVSTAHAVNVPAGDASTGTPVVRLGRTDGKTKRYLIDNSLLKIQKSPGVAFRHSKTESDKVMTGPGPAKWGDTVEGTDEGDGWLKVGHLYLPMLHQGVPIIKLVAEADCIEKSVLSERDAAESKSKPEKEEEKQVQAAQGIELDNPAQVCEENHKVAPSQPTCTIDEQPQVEDKPEVLLAEQRLEALHSVHDMKLSKDEHDIDVEDVEDAAEFRRDKQLLEFVQSELMPNKQEF